MATAVAAAAVAFVAPPLSPRVGLVLAVALAVVAIALRHPSLVLAAVLVVVGVRSHDAVRALERPAPRIVEGVAQLASDPEQRRFDVQAVLRLDGRRYVASVPLDLAAPVRDRLVGEHVVVRGRVAALRGAPRGWVLSRHLAGRLQVQRVERGPPSPPWYSLANALRRNLVAGAGSFDEERRPLYLGMVIGDDRQQSELTEFRFRASGLSHLLAVSGQNVAFVVAVASPLLDRLRRRARTTSTLALLLLFALVTSADPSVLRASVMAGVAVLAVAGGRVAPALRVLALTVTLLMLVDPLMVHSLGFQLSVSATAGLVLLTRPIERVLPGPAWLTLPVAVTLAAQLATAPLLLALVGDLPAGATVANLLAGPAAGAIMVSGMTVGSLAGLVDERLAWWLLLPTRWAVAWVDGVAAVVSRSPLGPVRPWQLAAFALLGGLAWAVRRTRWRRAAVASACALCLVVARPGGAAPGTTVLADGAQLSVGRCGGRVVELTAAPQVMDVLEGVWRAELHRVDVLVVTDGRAREAAHALEAQLQVRRRVDIDPDGSRAGSDGGPDGVEAAPARGASAVRMLAVGGLEVRSDGVVAPTEPSGAACRLTR